LRHDDLDGIGGGTEDRADLWDVLDAAEHIDREAVAQHDDEHVSGADGRGVSRGHGAEHLVVALHTREAWTRRLVERDAELHLRTAVTMAS